MGTENTKLSPIYPYSEWEVVEESFKIESNARNETIFALANGYLGIRGNFEEGYSGPAGTGLDGTYVNGFYESEFIKYGEKAYGFAEKSQTMLNVTNGKIIKLYVEDEEFDMLKGEVTQYRRALSLKEGVLRRSLVWCSPGGRKVRINIIRLVSLNNKHLAAISYEVTPLNFSGNIKLVSAIDGNVSNLTAEDDPRVGSGLKGKVLSIEDNLVEGSRGILVQRTHNTSFALVCAMENHIETQNSYTLTGACMEYSAEVVYEIYAQENKQVRLNKYIAYVTSRDCQDDKLVCTAKAIAANAKIEGFENIKKCQKDFMDGFWSKTDIKIKGDIAVQQGIRVNMYHLLQSAGRDGKTNIAAKGLTGEGYEGHYFWDTEIYILPFFLYNNPDISRKLLEYRYSILDKARENARQLAHEKGALFPWRTIGGEECSAYFPAGTAQYHINGDVAFAIKSYMNATEDKEFLVQYGAEILFETARLWADLGGFIKKKGNKFCINTVTGPDEYSAIVNNNCYTNLMAKENMSYAYETASWMKENANGQYQRLTDKIGLEEAELKYWKKAADNMYIPYDDESEIYLQDDSFLDREKWDFENTPKDKYPLLMHYHPLVIYRYQVCKQADMVLALLLLGNRFTKEEKRRNYDFYEAVTTHDSSLSTCTFSIVASEIGYHEKAYRYFMNTARMDMDNYHGNTRDGIHAANMAGAWMCIVNGFAGMRAQNGILSFNPYLPKVWEEYSFKVVFKGRLIGIKIRAAGADYELLEGEELTILHNGEQRLVK